MHMNNPPTTLDVAELTSLQKRDDTKSVSLKVARHVLSYWGDERLGQPGGHFVNRLIRLLLVADESNAAKVAAADPGWAEYERAVHALYRTPWGPDWLRGIVEKSWSEAGERLDAIAAEAGL